MTPREALEKAIAVLGSQKAVAEAAGPDVKTGHVYYWLNTADEVPARYCPGIERATREKVMADPAAGDVVFCEQMCPSTDWASVRSQSGPRAPKTDRAAASSSRRIQNETVRVLRAHIRNDHPR
jgi:DNA-binding transcriptional regulator YdaS (Cro superfamily)